MNARMLVTAAILALAPATAAELSFTRDVKTLIKLKAFLSAKLA